MRVYNLIFGISDIYTHLNPPINKGKEAFIPIPSKKPYVIFYIPAINSSTNPDRQYFKENTDINTLKQLGYSKEINGGNGICIIVTSDSKVIPAIELFFKMTPYQHPKNENLFRSLLLYKNRCANMINNDQKYRMRPSKSKLINNYQMTSVTFFATHKTHLVFKKSNPNKKYIFKENRRSLSDFEAYNSYCFRLLLGQRHPKIKSVYNSKGERLGTLSEQISPLESCEHHHTTTTYKDKRMIKNVPDINEYVHSEMIKVWVAAYVEEENDLHDGNYGFGPRGYIVKWDDDQATLPLIIKYYTGEKYLDCFPVTQRDIKNFPFLTDAKPTNWPTKEDYFQQYPHFLPELMKIEKVIHDMYYMFLRRILIPTENYQVGANACFRSVKLRIKAAQHKQRKTEVLKKELLENPEFQNYVFYNPHVIDTLLKEFTEFNQEIIKPKDVDLRVDLQKIKDNYDQLLQQIRSQKTIPHKDIFFSSSPSSEGIGNDSDIDHHFNDYSSLSYD